MRSPRCDARSGLRAALLLFVVLWLAACAGQRPRAVADAPALQAQVDRERALRLQDDWGLQGRLAVSGGGDGGSGQLLWRRHGEQTLFEVRAPVSRQTWRLHATPGHAVLEGLDGGPREGRDAAALIGREVGWDLPLDHLDAWVRGMRGAGPARIEFDADGLPRLIEQAGWRIEYRSWDTGQSPPLPSRVFASRGDHRVRLAIARWNSRP